MPEGRPLIIAHRGASARLPENTLAAVRGAVEDGADMVELDVRVTRDGVPVVIHDSTIRRILGVRRAVRDLTWHELEGLMQSQVGHVPRLVELLEALGGEVPLDLELKTPWAERPVVELLRQYRTAEGTLISAEDPRTLERLRALAPECRRGAVISPTSLQRILGTWGWRSFSCPRSGGGVDVVVAHRLLAGPRFLASARAQGVAVYVWTVDDPQEMISLSELRVDGVVTNRPDLLSGLRCAPVG